MAYSKLFTILMATLFIGATFGKSEDPQQCVESNESIEKCFGIDEMRKNPTTKQNIVLFYYDSLYALYKNQTKDIVNAFNSILKDDVLLANQNDKVKEFKRRVSEMVNHRNVRKFTFLYTPIIAFFNGLYGRYLQENDDGDDEDDQQSSGRRFIANILEKYEYKLIAQKYAAEYDKIENELRMQLYRTVIIDNVAYANWYTGSLFLTDPKDKFLHILKLSDL